MNMGHSHQGGHDAKEITHVIDPHDCRRGLLKCSLVFWSDPLRLRFLCALRTCTLKRVSKPPQSPDARLHGLNGSDVMHTKVRVATIVVLLFALGLFAVTEWLPALLFLPAAAGVLLVNESGMLTPGRPRNDRDRSRT